MYRKNAVGGRTDLKTFTRWEMDYGLDETDRLELLDEYLEMGQ